MNRLYYYFLTFIIFFSVVYNINSADSSFVSYGSSANTESPDQFYLPQPLYPDYGAVPQTSKLKTTILGQGIIGFTFTDPRTGIIESGFEFPANRNINYMQYSGLWVGGIVDNDTLVSTSICQEFIYYNDNIYPTIQYEYDFHPPYINGDTASTILYHTDDGEVFHTTFTDTFIPEYTIWSMYNNKHKPLGLHVTLKTYTKNIPPFKNIILLDYILTNKSSKSINSAYVGMYSDTWVQGSCETVSYNSDDLIGSFRNKGVVYVMDNDGELNLPNCQSDKAAGTMALKTMTTYPPPTDTNFNWWTFEYAPQKKGTAQYPFRNIGDDTYNTPAGDSNRYYLMSHPEWDFDQCFSKKIINSDSTWVTTEDSVLTETSKGKSPNFVLSLGPFDLLPDSSIRTVFALIGSDFVHLNKSNYQNLLDEKYDEYYGNLFFDIFFDNIRFAKILTDDYLNPLNKPIGLIAKPLSSTSYYLNWDSYVFPEVFGYNIYVKEIPDEYMLSQNIVRPDIDFDNLPTQISFHTTQKNELVLENLLPDRKYLVTIAHAAITGEGKLSKPIIIGTDNPFIKPPKVQPALAFAPIHPEYNHITLKWNYPDNSEIDYYKIFRAKDSISALTRYSPFLYSHPADIPFLSQQCFDIDDSIICYYEWRAFDSIGSNTQQYTVRSVDEGVCYWITAVNKFGIESELSSIIKSMPTPELTKDIVAIIGSTDNENDYVYEDSLVIYFNQLLEDYNYDIYKWTDSNLVSINCSTGTCVNWEDLAKYKLILINEYPLPKILTEESESQNKLFTKLSDLGNNIAFFGIPSGNEHISISTRCDSVYYSKLSFERNYMGIEQTELITWFGSYETFDATDILGGFNAAVPYSTSLPELRIKSEPSFYKPFIKQLFAFDNYIPFTPAFTTTGNSTVLYTYKSAFPETSELHGKPVGIAKQNRNNQIFTFGFHLWAMELQTAKNLIQYLFNKQSQHYPAYNIPSNVTLNQNYPNPFNATTNISFSLPAKYTVTVEVFNILGQKIKTLLPLKNLDAGTHRVSWDGRNEQNNNVSTGIYFYRLKIDEYTFTNKMVLLK